MRGCGELTGGSGRRRRIENGAIRIRRGRRSATRDVSIGQYAARLGSNSGRVCRVGGQVAPTTTHEHALPLLLLALTIGAHTANAAEQIERVVDEEFDRCL